MRWHIWKRGKGTLNKDLNFRIKFDELTAMPQPSTLLATPFEPNFAKCVVLPQVLLLHVHQSATMR